MTLYGRVLKLALAVPFLALVFLALVSNGARAGIDHDRFGTVPVDIGRTFQAFTLSFDSRDDDNGDGEPDAWGIPHWVAQRVDRFNDPCIPTSPRPKWRTDRALAAQRIAPTDKSYSYRGTWRKLHPDWYERGHLAMKLLAERLGKEAAAETFMLLNAVPQRKKFNSGIWQNLEYLTGDWAQQYGKVWIITGPIIIDNKPSGYIGEEKEFKVAIPDALFKIVAREDDNNDGAPEVLAFVYPQVGPGYYGKEDFRHERFLVSVDTIEKLTGLNFFTRLPPAVERKVEASPAARVWPLDPANKKIRACRK